MTDIKELQKQLAKLSEGLPPSLSAIIDRGGRAGWHIERFWLKVRIDPAFDACWKWTGAKHEAGYGKFRKMRAHIVSFLLHGGVIQPGQHIDHLCRNRDCVRPSHLEAVTPGENVRRGMGPSAQNFKRTHCEHGHEFNDANTRYYTTPRSKGRVWRSCRACARVSATAMYRNKKATAQ